MRDCDGIRILQKQGPMGKLFNPARRYFEKFKSADAEIAEIVKSLEKGKKTLSEDNVTLEIEETEMIAKRFNLCVVIYDSKPRIGFTHVNMNFEPDTKLKSKPNHLKIWEVKFNLFK